VRLIPQAFMVDFPRDPHRIQPFGHRKQVAPVSIQIQQVVVHPENVHFAHLLITSRMDFASYSSVKIQISQQDLSTTAIRQDKSRSMRICYGGKPASFSRTARSYALGPVPTIASTLPNSRSKPIS